MGCLDWKPPHDQKRRAKMQQDAARCSKMQQAVLFGYMIYFRLHPTCWYSSCGRLGVWWWIAINDNWSTNISVNLGCVVEWCWMFLFSPWECTLSRWQTMLQIWDIWTCVHFCVVWMISCRPFHTNRILYASIVLENANLYQEYPKIAGLFLSIALLD